MKVEAEIPNGAGTLKPGTAIVITMSFPGEPQPSVPSLSVQWDRQGPFVWKLDGDTVHRTGVQISCGGAGWSPWLRPSPMATRWSSRACSACATG